MLLVECNCAECMVKVIYRVCKVEVEVDVAVVAGRSVVVNTYLWWMCGVTCLWLRPDGAGGI